MARGAGRADCAPPARRVKQVQERAIDKRARILFGDEREVKSLTDWVGISGSLYGENRLVRKQFPRALVI